MYAGEPGTTNMQREKRRWMWVILFNFRSYLNIDIVEGRRLGLDFIFWIGDRTEDMK